MQDAPQYGTGFLRAYEHTVRRLTEIAEDCDQFDRQARPPEKLVSAIWFDQQLDHDKLRTVQGRKLRVLSPGIWNTAPGPDFMGARLRTSTGPIIEGDVEVHVFASEWRRHGHADDPAYRNVILQVCMWDDSRAAAPSPTPLLELFPYLADTRLLADCSTYGLPLGSAAMRGRCSALVDSGRMRRALAFITAAGDARIRQKTSRLASLTRAFGFDQTLYKGLMEACGYPVNKEPLSRVADVLHLDLLRSIISAFPIERRGEVVQTLLLGCSGFFDMRRKRELPESLRSKHASWNELQGTHDLTVIRGMRMARLRPANNPFRRLAAVSQLLAGISGLKLFDYFLSVLGNVERQDKKSVSAAAKRLKSKLTCLTDDYWDYRLTENSSALPKPQKLIGDELATIIVVNIIVPLMLAFALRREHRDLELFLREMLDHLGGLPHNKLTRFTCARILGPESIQPSFARNARMHQGLLQIYYDFCRSLRDGCRDCDFVDFLVEEGF